MLRSVWMRPALQKCEAVLMPALQRERVREPLFSDYRRPPSESDFVPVTTTALSTYVRPRGSLAGRSVLRAVGMEADGRRVKPRYYQKRQPVYGSRGRR